MPFTLSDGPIPAQQRAMATRREGAVEVLCLPEAREPALRAADSLSLLIGAPLCRQPRAASRCVSALALSSFPREALKLETPPAASVGSSPCLYPLPNPTLTPAPNGLRLPYFSSSPRSWLASKLRMPLVVLAFLPRPLSSRMSAAAPLDPSTAGGLAHLGGGGAGEGRDASYSGSCAGPPHVSTPPHPSSPAGPPKLHQSPTQPCNPPLSPPLNPQSLTPGATGPRQPSRRPASLSPNL